MVKSLAAPSKYYQGPGLLEKVSDYTGFIGTTFAVLLDEVVMPLVRPQLEKSYEESGGSLEFILFGGESTDAEGDRIATLALEKGCAGVIGAGGGKVIDTAKLAADKAGLPVVIIPTAAASDAPCSANSVIYDEEGAFVVSKACRRNPDVVVVDTKIITEAPVRLLVAGMGDAFATYYEARACKRSGVPNFTGGLRSEAGYALAALCNELLLGYGAEAKACVEKKEWSEAVEKIAEANIYLSGVGYENNGCAIAHAIYNGLTAVLKPFPVLHGEGVAFGTIVQLIAEYQNAGRWDQEEWKEVTEFYKAVGLPLTFRDIGLTDVTDDLMMEIAEATCIKSKNAHKMPFTVTPDIIKEALAKNLSLFEGGE